MCNKILWASLLAVALVLGGCGSSGTLTSNNINGNWTATLTNSDGSLAYQFSATFAQGSGSELSITNLTYTASSACPALTSEGQVQGSFAVATGAFAMTQTLLNVGGPILSLQGKAGNGRISGQWTLSGLVPRCSGNGSFTISPMTAT